MTENDNWPTRASGTAGRMRLSDLAEALQLLTRLPVRPAVHRGVRSAWAWPLVGVPLGLLGGLLAWLAIATGLPAPLAAGLALGALIALTGALHEDGLADCADGFWGGQTQERRLQIMKDSRSGSYGVLALGLALILRWQAMALLFSAHQVIWPLVTVAVLSRVPMVVLMSAMPSARPGGLSGGLGRPSGRTAALAGIAALLAAIIFGGFTALACALAMAPVAAGWAVLARARIGGQTGDVLGASQQLAEITGLLVLAALWG